MPVAVNRDDVIVVGGSFAGISAALAVARTRRSVRVIDAGQPRNRLSPAAHNAFGLDGIPPAEALAKARAQLEAYPNLAWQQGSVTGADAEHDGFLLRLADGGMRRARRLVLAYGVSDDLPPIAGLAECWGRSVLHCPYCHGYEVAGRHWGVLTDPKFVPHLLPLYDDWTDRLTLFTDGRPLDAAAESALAATRARLVTAPVRAVMHDGAAIRAVDTAEGAVPVDVLFAPSAVRPAADLAEALGCAMDDGPMGRLVRIDHKAMTTVPGVYAAGDLAGPMHSISTAIGGGAAAGAFAHQSLVFPAVIAADP